jgi:hypothetical protein
MVSTVLGAVPSATTGALTPPKFMLAGPSFSVTLDWLDPFAVFWSSDMSRLIGTPAGT